MAEPVHIYTDGSCSGNPGPGGFAALIIHEERLNLLVSGGSHETTNNRMELAALMEALRALNRTQGYRNHDITVTSDATYIVNAFNQGWIANWLKQGWTGSKGQPVSNRDLWERILTELEGHKADFQWVKGHSGHPYNDYCDRIAVQQANEARNRSRPWSTVKNTERVRSTTSTSRPGATSPVEHAAQAASDVAAAIKLQRTGELNKAMSLLHSAQDHLTALQDTLPNAKHKPQGKNPEGTSPP